MKKEHYEYAKFLVLINIIYEYTYIKLKNNRINNYKILVLVLLDQISLN